MYSMKMRSTIKLLPYTLSISMKDDGVHAGACHLVLMPLKEEAWISAFMAGRNKDHP